MLDRRLLEPSGLYTKKGKGLAHRGAGILWVRRGSDGRGVDTHLWELLGVMADQLRVAAVIRSIDTELSVDISHLAPYDPSIGLMEREIEAILEASPVTPENREAVRVSGWLLRNGFVIGGGRPKASVLFGPVRSKWNNSLVNHDDHLHVSIPRRRMG